MLNIKKKEASCGKKEIERTCFHKYIYHLLSYGDITVYNLIPEFLKILDFSHKVELLENIRKTINSLYWDLETLKLSLDCKNIDYPADITKLSAKYMIEYYFANIYNPNSPDIHPADPIPTPTIYGVRDSKLLRKSFKQSIAVGILYYNLIRDGWIGFSFQKTLICWFNINRPYFSNEQGKLFIENKVAIWVPNLPQYNSLQILSKIQFISKIDLPKLLVIT